MYEPKPNPRKEYRQQESRLVEDSATLAQTFPDLKALTVALAYFRPGSFTRNSELKYTVNLANAKSRFRFSCPNDQCVGGDFDLTAVLAAAVSSRKTTAAGELTCQGWRSQPEVGQSRCLHILRFKLRAEYQLCEETAGKAAGENEEEEED